ncbi:MAG: hypothetical protein KatS3mg057_0779 [Herpetosiphonaceae bacterium]|nr:MAG: hypothetical protein KatS3mg057_0779 [Herpetosiphonaceae bacterium]
MPQPIVLSFIQAKQLLKARAAKAETALASPDLGISMVEVTIADSGAIFPGGECLSWDDATTIAAEETRCFVLEHGRIKPIQIYSEETDRFYSLMPTEGAPTLLISGIPMHRIKGTDPYKDTLSKVRTIAPIRGRVLDTATGLGYTAIEEAKTAEQVITVEFDPAALEIARLNPWSRRLFDNPTIEQRIGDVFDVVQDFADGSFSCILHDPPMFSLAGQLYSGEFYRQLYRVLKRGGRLFHYIGDPSNTSAATVTRGAVRRLQEAGFTRIVRRPEAFGVVAYK